MTVQSRDPSRLAIHQISVLEQCSFRQSVETFAASGVHATGVWYEKLCEIPLGEARTILADNAMLVPAVCAGGLMTDRNDLRFQQAIDRNRRMLDDCAEIGGRSMVVIAGGLTNGEKDLAYARSRALEGLAKLVDHAAKNDLRIALEPLHPMVTSLRSVVNTLATANDWCDQIGAEHTLGIALDTYAVWWDPDLPAQIARAGKRIIGFHLSDWLADTRDVRVDRGMMGDGVIDLASLCNLVDACGYDGFYEVEILSARDWWQRPAHEVVEIIKQRYQTSI